MINLLSPESKRQIRAARTNVILRTYCLLLGVVAILLTATFSIAWWVVQQDKSLAQAEIQSNQQAAAEYAKTRKAAQAFAQDLTVAKSILANNISFSTLLTDIASVVPKGVILNNLSLAAATATAPVDVSGRSKTSDGAVALKNSLEASPIFENVSISSITRTDTAAISQTDPITQQYPFTVNLKVQFTKKATSR